MALVQERDPREQQDTEFVQFWNEILAPKFIRFKHVLVDGLSRHSKEALPRLPIRRGDRVLDVGCGFGDTAIEFARMVGREGHVVAVDCCDDFMDFGREEAQQAGLENLEFRRADAEVALPKGEFDFTFSRFGTMFFVNPVAGLRNMREALKPGGRMAHIVWRDRADNPWAIEAKRVVSEFLPEPGEDARTCGPGPFSMSDRETVEAQMKSAGYEDIEFQRVDEKVLIGSTAQDAIDFALAIGPAGEVFREAGDLAEERRPEIEAALTDMFEEHEKDAQGIWMMSSSWIVTARNPE